MSKLARVLGVLALLGAATTVCADTTDVHIFNFAFSPDPTINTGDTIHWIWDSGLHSTTSVTGLSESWDSGGQSGATFDHTFTNLGSFPYYCSIHRFDNGNGTAGGMSGVINVTPEPATVGLLLLGAAAVLRRRSQRKPAR